MPIFRCNNGKYRIGTGECMYDSRTSAQRAYVAYLASKADKNKISFDYDDTLEEENIQEIALRFIAEGKEVYIITRRQETDSKDVYEDAEELGIRKDRIIFTNGKMKWETIKRLNIGIHYDNNPEEIRLIQENTDAEGRLVNYEEEKAETYNDYPDAAVRNAKRAIKYKEENNSDCGTPVGWTRANQLANKEKLSRSTIARMASFKRHQQWKDVPYTEGCGGLMWDAWGGTEGIEWAIRKLEQIDRKYRTMIYNYKNFDYEIKDVDKKQGIVSGYFAAFNIKDADGDIIRPGAFKKTLNEMFPKGRIKHLMNHDPSKPLGKILELKEDEYGLFYRSQIGSHSLGQDFIKMVESDLIKEHSIGFNDLTSEQNRKGEGYNNITEVKLYEGSSLTAWGANEFTPLVELKGMNVDSLAQRIRKFEKFARNSDATDETIESCLLYIKQLAQVIEDLTTLDADEALMPEGQDENANKNFNISELKDFINTWTLKK